MSTNDEYLPNYDEIYSPAPYFRTPSAYIPTLTLQCRSRSIGQSSNSTYSVDFRAWHGPECITDYE